MTQSDYAKEQERKLFSKIVEPKMKDIFTRYDLVAVLDFIGVGTDKMKLETRETRLQEMIQGTKDVPLKCHKAFMDIISGTSKLLVQ